MGKDLEKIPLVSVLLPVYNSEAYVAGSIESILNQTYSDFEFIIINDGATDNSLSIISSFTDERIRIINNSKNIGLVESLNKGIDFARGKYIARMDADDISLPNRFKQQVNYLEHNPSASVLATRVALINADGELTGYWGDDTEFVKSDLIRKGTAFTNRIAHPSVMVRADLLKKYKYNNYQKGSEDWDLWLRILADKHQIHKLDEVLLHYRIHQESTMTGEKKKVSLHLRLINTKGKFLLHQLPKINSYFFLVTYSLLRSIASLFKYQIAPNVGRSVKRILTSSPIKVIQQYFYLKNTLTSHKTDFVFFFPYTHIGGAERVHADIVSVFKNEKPIVLFTAFSKDDKFASKFTKNAIVLNIPHALNHPFIHKRCLQLISRFIEEGNHPRIFGANSGYFYEIASLLSSRVSITDLVHAFKYQPKGNLIHKKHLSLSQKFTNRVFISYSALQEFKEFCFRQNYTKQYAHKLKLIYNCTEVPPYAEKKHRKELHLLFVGRGSEEKRLNLFIELAKRLNTKYPGNFVFNVIGANGHEPFISFHGEINDDEEIKLHYTQANILILTSSREGFPLVIMEAMAHGVVPVATPVGDIPLHVNDTVGFVISKTDEQVVIEEMETKIIELKENRKELERLSANANAYALKHFLRERFENEYRSLLNF